MKHFFITVLLAIFFVPAFSQVSIIPQPADITTGCCQYGIDKNVRIKSNLSKSDARFTEKYLKEELRRIGAMTGKGEIRRINIRVSESVGNGAHPDYYEIENTDGKSIDIAAVSPRAAFYAVQTMLQLFNDNGQACSASIKDYPRFPYRGLMIDCSRHVWDKEFLLKQIDAMARYKFTHLHLHLTDAGGWRVESIKYPQLTQKGAYRTASDWNTWWVDGTNRKYAEMPDGNGIAAKHNSPNSVPYGGYYTQDELREIVSYAAERHITVIPEIEMPGHSEEVIYALPHLSCEGKPYSSGEFCVGNEQTFEFLETILMEVMDIFPSEYIHIGGDETSRKSWETCEKCQQRMKEEGLSTTAELQSYLTERIERFLNSHGRKLMGWDEILEGYLAPNATVMSWRGTDGGLKASKMNHHVVMSPGGYCYLDAYQDAPATQPRAFGGYTPVERTYGFEPVPDEIRGTEYEKYIDGIQGNMWTEMIETPEHAEYMLWARALAIAEIGWSQKHDNYEDFRRRAIHATDDLYSRGYNAFRLSQEIGARKESKEKTMHEAVGMPVKYIAPYADVYKAAGEGSLTDGLSGDWAYGDGHWQGFITRKGFDIIVDMQEEKEIRDITVNFMQFAGPEIFAPANVEYYLSADGENFEPVYQKTYEVSRNPDYFIRSEQWKGNKKARYVRACAKAGKYGGWIFTDEIIINNKRLP